MNFVRDTIISYKYPTVSSGFCKYATWSKPNINFPRRCFYTRKWMWNKDKPMLGVYEHVKADGPMGMVFVVERRWICEEAYVILKLKGKIGA